MLQTNLGDALERREKAVSPVACSWVQGRPIADTQNLAESMTSCTYGSIVVVLKQVGSRWKRCSRRDRRRGYRRGCRHRRS